MKTIGLTRVRALLCMLILIFGLVCCTDASSGDNSKNVLERFDPSEVDAILESSTSIDGFGNVDIILIRGHEYAVFITDHYQNMSQSIEALHLKETCIGCRGGNLIIDTVTISSHQYELRKEEYKDGKNSVQIMHLDSCKVCKKE